MTTTVTARDALCPVSLIEAKEHLRVTDGTLDVHIESLIQAATEYCESVTGRSLRLSETIVQSYDCWTGCRIQLDRQPALAVSSLKYYLDGTLQTVGAGNYRLHKSRNAAAHVEIDSDYSRPTHDTREDAVQLTYTAGYDSIADDPGADPTPLLGVPAMAKHAIKLIVGHWFNHNEAVNVGNITSNVPLAADALLAQLDWGCYR